MASFLSRTQRAILEGMVEGGDLLTAFTGKGARMYGFRIVTISDAVRKIEYVAVRVYGVPQLFLRDRGLIEQVDPVPEGHKAISWAWYRVTSAGRAALGKRAA